MGRAERDNARRRLAHRLNGADRSSHVITGAPGDPVVLDAFGREVREGDGVTTPETGGVVWTVGGITRVLDPRAPSGLVIVGLYSELPVQVQDRQRSRLLLVLPRDEAVATPTNDTAQDGTAPDAPDRGEGDHHDTPEPPASPEPPGTAPDVPSRIVGLDGQPFPRDPREE